MPLFPRLRSLFRNLFHKRRVEVDLDEEMSSYVGMLVEEKIRAGMAPEAARRSARLEAGGIQQLKEEVREARMGAILESVWADLRYSVRMLAKSPGFTAVAILTLAVGIGANTAIFSVMNAVLLRSLPYPNADRLVMIWTAWGTESRAPGSGPEFVYLRERSRLFQDIAGIWATSGALTGDGEPEQVKVAHVSSNFLSLLSPHPELGRFFLSQEQGAGGPRVVILTDGLWRRRFGANPQLVGRSILLNGQPFTVVGIMPPGFKLIFPADSHVPPDIQVFTPFPYDLAKSSNSLGFIRMIGVLGQGVTPEQAQAEVASIAGQLRSEFTDFSEQKMDLSVALLHGDTVKNVRPALLALFAGVGLVLLVACVNVANLLLARANERQKEITLRRALGAAPGRIIRQLLTESIVLGFLGGAAALAVGWWALKWLLALRPEAIERMGSIQFDGAVFVFDLLLSLFTGVLFGLVPAFGAAKADLVGALKEGGRTAAAGKQRFRNALIVCEVALGFVLLIGAGLMIRTFAGLLRVDPGFDSAHVLTFQLALPGKRYPQDQSRVNFLRQLEKDIAALPGVQSVSATSHLPFDDDLPNWYSYYWPEGAPKQDQNTVMADQCAILPGFFKSMGATLITGRDFNEFDDAAHGHVVIVDDALARRTWPNESALGKKLIVEIMLNGEFSQSSAEVVGVVKHVQIHSLTNQVREQIYVPYPLAPRNQIAYTIRTPENPQSLIGPLRAEVAKLDKDLAVSKVFPMDDYVAIARTETRFTTMLSSVLAAIALLLACIGIYGVTSYAVLGRTSEIGVRMALGAQKLDILKLIIRQSMFPVILGALLGSALSLALTPLLSGLLFGVRPSDPLTFAFVAVFLLLAGLVACYLPARWAMRIEPMDALRFE
jgi:predicted permease